MTILPQDMDIMRGSTHINMLASVALMTFLFAALGEGRVAVKTTPVPNNPVIPLTLANFSNRELQCFMEEKVLHPDGKCYQLRHTGPCREDEWLVLDTDDTPLINGVGRRNLVCKTKPCNGTLRIYWAEDGECYKPSDKARLCPYTGNVLRVDSYGDGECACEKGHVRFETDVMRGRNTSAEWEGVCYPVFHRGPCPQRKILFPDILDGFGVVGKCFPDYCHGNNSRDPDGGYVMHKEDRSCYKLGTPGPCSAGEKYNIHPATYKPQCFSPGLSVFNPMVDRCGGNFDKLNGTCRPEVEFKVKSMSFIAELTMRKGRKTTKRHVKTSTTPTV